jgi:polysaccharide biosynthesis/export protein ExoF
MFMKLLVVDFKSSATYSRIRSTISYRYAFGMAIVAIAILLLAKPGRSDDLYKSVSIERTGGHFSDAEPAQTVVTGGQDENYRLDTGDHLRIRFLDRYDREDLNGEYVINENGQLRLPRIGVFSARNLRTDELEKNIRVSAEDKAEKLGYFSIEVSQCRPFYVSGLVNGPGSYSFVPGFTVLHAVAIAGGLRRSTETSATEALRERRTLAETLDRLMELVTRRARLQAEQDDAPKIAIPAELTLADSVRAEELIDSEQTVLLRQREVDSREKLRLEGLIATHKKEADGYSAEVERIVKRVEDQTTIFTQLKKLHDDKIINQQRFLEAVNALDAVQRDKQSAIGSLSRANAELEKAEHDLSTIEVAKSARLAKEIAETDRSITRLKMSAAKTRQLIFSLDAFSDTGGSGQVAEYKIMRRNGSGQLIFIPATETTPVKPGDVIQIENRPARVDLARE